MKLNWLLIISALYFAFVGLGFLIAPDTILFGTLGAGAASLIAIIRGVSGTFIGIAVLNWFARDSEPTKALNAVVLANTVGFGLAGIVDAIAVLSGAPMLELIPTIINLLFAVAFARLGRATMSGKSA